MVLDRTLFHKSYEGVELLSVEMRGTQRSFSTGEPDVYFSPTGNTAVSYTHLTLPTKRIV